MVRSVGYKYQDPFPSSPRQFMPSNSRHILTGPNHHLLRHVAREVT
jgi:hypothetical protein